MYNLVLSEHCICNSQMRQLCAPKMYRVAIDFIQYSSYIVAMKLKTMIAMQTMASGQVDI